MIASAILNRLGIGAKPMDPTETPQAAAPAAALTLADLWQVCPECNGSGEPKPQTNTKKPEGLMDPAHFFNHVAATASCRECEGRRGKPTPTGQAVLDFLAKNAERPYRNNMTGQYLRGA